MNVYITTIVSRNGYLLLIVRLDVVKFWKLQLKMISFSLDTT